MAEQNQDPPESLDSGVPGLIDQYRQQRRAWLAQADELVRLRDEVRAAAEREAMDIVTVARRDVRQIVVEARRELMVLTAQLHAAMDAVEQSSAATMSLPDGTEDPAGTELAEAHSSLGLTRELVLGARREVRSVLDEARAEIEALASEAPVPFPSEEEPPADQESPSIGKLFEREPRTDESRVFAIPESLRIERLVPPAAPAEDDSGIFSSSNHGFSSFGEREAPLPFASSVLAPDLDAPPARPAKMFVALFAAVGVAVTIGTIWWLVSARGDTARAESTPAAATTPPAESTAPPVSTVPVNTATADSLSLRIEARRPSWLRASVDGQPDDGRLYQAGEIKEIAGARNVVVRAGDAGAVMVSINGEPARPLGNDGEVVTRRFSADTPAPRSTTDANAGRDAAPRPAPPVSLAVENSRRPATTPRDVRPTTPPAAAAPNTPPAAREAATGGATSGGRPDLVVAGQQWLDAYQRRDRQAMSATGVDNITVTDERSTAERFPPAQNGVQRELDQVELALTGDTALLTARMTERADGGASSPHVSRVSQIWVRRAGQWRLADVRIMAEARLNQIVR